MYMYIVSRELGLCTVLNEHNVILVVQVLKFKEYEFIYSELRPFFGFQLIFFTQKTEPVRARKFLIFVLEKDNT